MFKKLFVGCSVLAAVAAAGIYSFNLSVEEGDPAVTPDEPTTIKAQKATIVEEEDPNAGPLEKAGRVADDLIEKAGLSAGNVEAVAEKAQELGEKAAESAGTAIEKVKETASKAVVKAEELADKGKDAALEAADDLGESIKTTAGAN